MATPFDQIYRFVPLARNRQTDDSSMFTDIEGWFQYHKSLIIENWWYYHGYHNLFLKQWDAEERIDYMKRVQSASIENHIKPIINLIVAHLYSQEGGVKRYVERGEEPDEELNDFLEYSVWEPNQIEEVDDSKALQTLVSGYTVIQRQFIDTRTELPFSPAASAQEKVKYGYVKKIPLDSSTVIPLPYVTEDGLTDYRKVGAILFFSNEDNFMGSKEAMDLLGRPLHRKQVIEYIDDKIWVKWVKGQGENSWTQVTINPGTKYQNRNQYGRVDVPFTVYKNTGDPFSVEGQSDVQDMKSLNLELNELANGDKDVIIYHQNPILQGLEGAKLPVGFVRKKNTVLELEGKGKFEYLTWDGTLTESRERQDSIKRSLSFVTGISLLTRGFMKDIGQIRSGPPLKALFSSDRAVMSRKFVTFKKSEVQDMKSDALFYQVHTSINFDIDKTVIFECEFASDFLGIDKLLEAEIKALEISSGGEDIVEILREVHPDWSDAEIKAAMERTKAFAEKPKIQSQSGDKKGLQQSTE